MQDQVARTSPRKTSAHILRPQFTVGFGVIQDFTCLTFIDDSPPLQTWGKNNKVIESLEESDRSSGRAVLGTAIGDLYIFIQRGVRLIPREVCILNNGAGQMPALTFPGKKLSRNTKPDDEQNCLTLYHGMFNDTQSRST